METNNQFIIIKAKHLYNLTSSITKLSFNGIISS